MSRTCANDASHTETSNAHSISSNITKAATCSSTGTKVYTAAFPVGWATTQTKTETLAIDASAHSWNVPTYTWSGYTACTGMRVCAYNSAHTETTTGTITSAVTKEKTCTTDGTITYTATFDKTWASNQIKTETIPASHNYVRGLTTKPTCTTNGYTTYTCADCGASYQDEFTPATGHSYTTKVTAPTCTTRGYTTYTCACGDSYRDNYIDALGHIEVLLPAGAATCTTDGKTEGKYCSRCNTTLIPQETIGKLGHLYSIIKIEPTCTEQGYNLNTCGRCGHTYMDNHTDALGHNWATATCDAPKTCKTCGATSGEALGHNEVVDPAVLATCTTTGLTAGSHCSRCGKVFTPQQTIPALGHTWVGATCTTSKTCSVCGTTEGASLGHQWGAATYSWSDDNSTCTATRTCVNDSAHIQTARANVTSKVTTEPTCATTGVRTYYAEFEATWCASQQTTGTIPATGEHTWGVITITRQPTCTTTGTKTSTCKVCNAPLFEVIPATGVHTPGNWEITLEPTTTSTGTRVKKCTQCQAVQQTETIPKIVEYDLAVNISTTAYQQAGSGAYITGKVATMSGTVANKIKSDETLTYKLIPAATKTGNMQLSIGNQTNATCTLVADNTSRTSYTLTITGATGDVTVNISGRVP